MGKGIVAMVLGILTAGCNPTLATFIIVQPGAGTPVAHPAGCPLHVYQASDSPPASCREIGDVFLGDTGLSTDCGKDRVLRELHEHACSLGGDAYQLVREHAEGSYGSNCYQVRARILVCPGCSS